jgi:acetyl-CoA acetyltransferase family protein
VRFVTADVWIVDGARTPIGAFGGGLRDVPAARLGQAAAAEALRRSGVRPADVEDVCFGNVMQTSADAVYLARHVALGAGVPEATPALTLNRICGSGLQAVVSGAHAILAGDARVVLAGGSENMSQAPHVLRGARWGYRLQSALLEDTLAGKTSVFYDPAADLLMGGTAEVLADRYGIGRGEMDAFALRSQERALAARASGRLAEEIVAVGEAAEDEHPRETSLEKLAQLRPVFRAGGRVTVGNSSGINDGACALVLASADRAAELGLEARARLVSWAVVGCEPVAMGLGPVGAARRALARAGLGLADLDLIEVNEAFAAQYLAVERELGLDRERVNVNGGAIALGHPLAASGARILLTLIYELGHRGGRYGLATACIGGGQGIAVVVERLGAV